MEFTFMNQAGAVLFTRGDIEDGHLQHEQLSLTLRFPFILEKRIEHGQRVVFRDHATDSLQVYEIRKVQNVANDMYQQITAEHICISDLQDEHINSSDITEKTAGEALSTVLSGTLWALGNNTAQGTQNADISRGSVWQAVCTIKENWNVYITPRIVISSAGQIVGRYLDIAPAQPVFHGLRLSIRKNMMDPAVFYDDSEVLTALYGYGGTVDVPQGGGGDDDSQELTFAASVWTATAEHPAKPSGQTYLEWPEKTALYGRNGRARFGYYQNGSIKDPDILLQKTWESLKKTADPKVTISGSVVDLRRLGYNGQPIRLHDLAIVEIEETGELLSKEITCFDEDLVNPDGDQVEIGDYIPNIIYINRETAKNARGGGGGGGRGQTNAEDEKIRTYTDFIKTDNMIGMVVGTRQGNNYIKAGQIILAINETGEPGSYETAAYVNADHVNISATNTAHLLAGSIVYDESGKLVLKDSSGAGIYIERQGGQASFGIWDQGNLTGGVMVQQINGQNTLKLIADVIDVQGLVNALTTYDLTTETLHATNTLTIEGEATFLNGVTCTDGSGLDGGYVDVDDVTTGSLTVGSGSGAHEATWQTEEVMTGISVGSAGARWYATSTDGETVTGRNYFNPVTSVTPSKVTIHYLGRQQNA